ncbi:hypothetical protein D3C78_1272080 [compost metagenome]
MNAQPYAPTISKLSTVSISAIPLANSAGKIIIDQTDMPCDALAAEIPSTPISVAVSNPRPNRKPTRYICQLLFTRRNVAPNNPLITPPVARSSASTRVTRPFFSA